MKEHMQARNLSRQRVFPGPNGLPGSRNGRSASDPRSPAGTASEPLSCEGNGNSPGRQVGGPCDRVGGCARVQYGAVVRNGEVKSRGQTSPKRQLTLSNIQGPLSDGATYDDSGLVGCHLEAV